MKNSKLSRVVFVLGSALLIGVPTSVLLPGCGGGSGGSGHSTKLFSAPVQLNSSQTATLNLSLQGQGISGSLIVPPTIPTNALPVRGEAAVPTIPAGTYFLTGTYLPPRSFTLTGDFPDPIGTFSVTGLLPTSTEAGNFKITVGSESVTGTIPISSATATPSGTPITTGTPTTTGTPVTTGTPSPTATPKITATPVPIGNGLQLTYSQISSSNVVPTNAVIPLTAGTINVAGGTLICIFQQPATNPVPQRALQFELRGQGALTNGKTFTLSGATGAVYFELLASGNNRRWDSTGGTLKIVSITPGTGNTSNVQLDITNASFKATNGFPSTGTFVLNGTAKAQINNGSGEG